MRLQTPGIGVGALAVLIGSCCHAPIYKVAADTDPILSRYRFPPQFDPTKCPDSDPLDFFQTVGLADSDEAAAGASERQRIAELFAGFGESFCQDLFIDSYMAPMLNAIPEASEQATRDLLGLPPDRSTTALQREATTALLRAKDWRYVHKFLDGDYGCTEPNRYDRRFSTATVFLYQSAHTAMDIYAMDITHLTPRMRLELIASHELGHVLDLASGKYENDPSRAEDRATIYGSFIAQCLARTNQFASAFGVWPQSPLAHPAADLRSCMVWRWRHLERTIAALRSQWVCGKLRLPPGADTSFRCRGGLHAAAGLGAAARGSPCTH